MPCILFDKYPYRKHEKHSVIPQKPMCLPENVHENMAVRKIFLFILLLPIFVILYMSPSLFSWLIPQLDCTEDFTVILMFPFIAAFIVICYKWDVTTLKKIQNPQLNPKGWMYQGRILSHDNIHVIQHIEYYRKHASWVIPDGTDLSLYTPQDMDAYLKALASLPIKYMTIKDLPDSCILNETEIY